MTNRNKIEDAISNRSPLPLTFTWQRNDDGNELLRIDVPVQTQAGRPAVVVAFPQGMPAGFQPRAIARARALIEEIFDANMVGIVFTGGPQPGIAMPQKKLLLPGSIAAGSA